MKRFAKLVTIVLIAVLLCGALPAVSARTVRIKGMDILIVIPDGWEFNRFSDSEKPTRLGVTYRGEFRASPIKYIRLGFEHTDAADTSEYWHNTVLKDEVVTSGVLGESKLTAINGSEYICFENALFRIYIHVKDNTVYQYEFFGSMYEKNQPEEIMASVKYLTAEESASYDSQTESEAVRDTTAYYPFSSTTLPNQKGKKTESGGTVPPMFVLLVIGGLSYVCFSVYRKLKKREETVPAAPASPKKTVPKMPLPKVPVSPKLPVQAEIKDSKADDPLEVFKNSGGYLKLDGDGFEERTGSSLAELALDIAGGYPQLTWAYYENDPALGSVLTVDAAPLPREVFDVFRSTEMKKALTAAVRELTEDFPQDVVINYDAIGNNKQLTDWCANACRLAAEFTWP